MKKKTGNPWFTWRETPAVGQTRSTPNVLLPMLDTSKVKLGVLRSIGNTPRLRIPRHMELIKDLGDAHTRLVVRGTGSSENFIIALDQEAVTMLRRAGAVLLRQSYRHELMGSTLHSAS